MASNEIIFIDNKFGNVKKSLQQHNGQKWHCSLLYVAVLITWHVLNVQCYMSLESQFSDLCDANKITKVRFSSEEYQFYNSRQWFTLSWTSRKWKCIYMFLKSSSLLPGIDQTNQVCSNVTREGSTKIINFMTPRAGFLVLGFGHIRHIVKMHYFFKNLLLYSPA